MRGQLILIATLSLLVFQPTTNAQNKGRFHIALGCSRFPAALYSGSLQAHKKLYTTLPKQLLPYRLRSCKVFRKQQVRHRPDICLPGAGGLNRHV